MNAESLEELLFPDAVMARLIKSVLPEGITVAKSARQLISESTTIFVLYLSYLMNTNANNAKRKTPLPSDLFLALEEAEFEEFLPALQQCFHDFRARKNFKTPDNLENDNKVVGEVIDTAEHQSCNQQESESISQRTVDIDADSEVIENGTQSLHLQSGSLDLDLETNEMTLNQQESDTIMLDTPNYTVSDSGTVPLENDGFSVDAESVPLENGGFSADVESVPLENDEAASDAETVRLETDSFASDLEKIESLESELQNTETIENESSAQFNSQESCCLTGKRKSPSFMTNSKDDTAPLPRKILAAIDVHCEPDSRIVERRGHSPVPKTPLALANNVVSSDPDFIEFL